MKYITCLEERIKQLTLTDVVGQSEQLFCDCYIKYPRNPKKKCYKCGLTKKCTW